MSTKRLTQMKEIEEQMCGICYEDGNVAHMFSADGCQHKYCGSCMKRHVEEKFLNGTIARCPHEGCNSVVDIDGCGKFLDPKRMDILRERMREATIPADKKVYCPNPRCSALMSKDDQSFKSVAVRYGQFVAKSCIKCICTFCMNCNVPWHWDQTCSQYKSSVLQKLEEKLMLLAEEKKWRQCARCKCMIELAEGCYHVTCRCGCEFCYACGAEWINNKATCCCPLWDERFVIREGKMPCWNCNISVRSWSR